MPPNMKDVLARIVKELDDEETREAFEEMKGRKVTLGEIRDAISEASPEDRATIRDLLREEGIDTSGPPAAAAGAAGDDDEKTEKKKPPEKKRATVTTRQGRKSGMAYDWDVDESGAIVHSSVALIYGGEDEPDEVVMTPRAPADDDDTDTGDDE